MQKSEQVLLANETKVKLPRGFSIPIQALKDRLLGKTYMLNVIFIGDAHSRKLNRSYRSKDKPTNILSFSIDKKEGELYVNLAQVKREVKLFERPFENLILFLLIHGMLHLKGFDHGSRMEAKEKAARTFFHI